MNVVLLLMVLAAAFAAVLAMQTGDRAARATDRPVIVRSVDGRPPWDEPPPAR
ncbi:hypothetical protein [Rhodococcus oxybenzonivorans]|uniref:hypothetical protein n=1 Tax=Rhodococcus oxybenzonivorans TaxID=1990687 RepID=UPI0013A59756|nr:hypothetical protein [Rhodococcus oxybenzonivorans]